MSFEQKVQILQIAVTFLTAVLASSSFWLYIDKLKGRGNLSRKLLIGLAHDRIVCLAMKYIRRGWITQDEHENLSVFLYSPYVQMGGNGSAQRLMEVVNSLPIKSQIIEHIIKETRDDS
jgi:hypothetical protein